jgi:uncharacterized protein
MPPCSSFYCAGPTFSADEGLTVVRLRGRARATGKALDMNLHRYFLCSGGKITYYRGTEDTAQTEAVLKP